MRAVQLALAAAVALFLLSEIVAPLADRLAIAGQALESRK